jgi:hypothetical protein
VFAQRKAIHFWWYVPFSSGSVPVLLFGPEIVLLRPLGGNGSVALNDVWAMDITVPFDKLRWQHIRPREGSALPPPRGYHTSNLVGNVMVIIGGSDGRDTYDDIWVMDLGTSLSSLLLYFFL